MNRELKDFLGICDKRTVSIFVRVGLGGESTCGNHVHGEVAMHVLQVDAGSLVGVHLQVIQELSEAFSDQWIHFLHFSRCKSRTHNRSKSLPIFALRTEQVFAENLMIDSSHSAIAEEVEVFHQNLFN